MSSVTVTYDDHRSFGKTGQPNDYRPYTEISLYGFNPNNPTPIKIWALIDSGADYLQVNAALAIQAGIDLNIHGTPKAICTAAGVSVNVNFVQNVTIEIEGKRVQVDCLFGQNNTPILGRTAILKAVDFGFDVNGWLLKT